MSMAGSLSSVWLDVHSMIAPWDMSTSWGGCGWCWGPSVLVCISEFLLGLPLFDLMQAMPSNSWHEVGALWRCIWSLVTLGSGQVSDLRLSDANSSVVTEDIWEIYLSSAFYWSKWKRFCGCTHAPAVWPLEFHCSYNFVRLFLLVDWYTLGRLGLTGGGEGTQVCVCLLLSAFRNQESRKFVWVICAGKCLCQGIPWSAGFSFLFSKALCFHCCGDLSKLLYPVLFN